MSDQEGISGAPSKFDLAWQAIVSYGDVVVGELEYLATSPETLAVANTAETVSFTLLTPIAIGVSVAAGAADDGSNGAFRGALKGAFAYRIGELCGR